MAAHEFGLLPKAPNPGKRFDRYEPRKYNCISLHDDLIEPLLPELTRYQMYFHSLRTPGMGLNYAGITLIPPEVSGALAALLAGRPGLEALVCLLAEAGQTGQFVIHFGI